MSKRIILPKQSDLVFGGSIAAGRERESELPGRLPNTEVSSKRRQMVKIACNLCRSRKIKCDGRKPLCSRCHTKGKACVYTANSPGQCLKMLKERLQEAENKYQHLLHVHTSSTNADGEDNTQHEFQVPGILPGMDEEMLKSQSYTMGDQSVCSSIPILPSSRFGIAQNAPNMHVSPGQILANRSTLMSAPAQPRQLESRSRDSNSLGPWLPDIERSNTTFVSSKLTSPKYLNLGQAFPCSSFHHTNVFASALNSMLPSSTLQKPDTAVLRPSRIGVFCDARLQRLDVSIWTRIPIKNHFAANVISTYLEADIPFHGLFNADLFVEDLIYPRIRFCCPLLFNCLMFVGCQTYTSTDQAAETMSYTFYRESVRLWDDSTKSDSLMNVLAMALLNIGCVYQGRDNEAAEYHQVTLRMGSSLGLFGTSGKLLRQEDVEPDLLLGTAHIAWGVFCWLSLNSFHYHTVGAGRPPALPMPSE